MFQPLSLLREHLWDFTAFMAALLRLQRGVKASQPDLFVWVVTGDGDGLSIGGNHLVHCMRRNVDLKIILVQQQDLWVNKRAVLSHIGIRQRKQSRLRWAPLIIPLNPIHLALAAEATFVARSFDIDTKHLSEILCTRRQAQRHCIRRSISELQHFQRWCIQRIYG